jgi:hypothetical protein
MRYDSEDEFLGRQKMNVVLFLGSILVFGATEDPPSGFLLLLFKQFRSPTVPFRTSWLSSFAIRHLATQLDHLRNPLTPR